MRCNVHHLTVSFIYVSKAIWGQIFNDICQSVNLLVVTFFLCDFLGKVRVVEGTLLSIYLFTLRWGHERKQSSCAFRTKYHCLFYLFLGKTRDLIKPLMFYRLNS